MIAAACALAASTRSSDSLMAASFGLLGLGQRFGPDPGGLVDVGLQPVGGLLVVLGRLGQQRRGARGRLLLNPAQLGHGLFALDRDLLPDVGGLALDLRRSSSVSR